MPPRAPSGAGEACSAPFSPNVVFDIGWGATCLEAQAAGVPVVAYRASGIVEVVEHGLTLTLTLTLTLS